MKHTLPKTFVSYTTRDGIINSKELSTLEKHISQYTDPFIDLLHNNSADKQTRVIKELEKSDVFILLKTKETFKSEWVKIEISKANELGMPFFQFDYRSLVLKQFKPIQRAINKTSLVST